ncbi:hypothetical protein SI65_03992 [Aspergillus cristatus]|uniref:Uncharacterized protein n=1 Tax=Aspergillus cristatus TaxID=573508 RepID=A0A1E3BJ18_ASPCR|nr:hypothetical protein SI65_03992 [Aspergillus cristatus]
MIKQTAGQATGKQPVGCCFAKFFNLPAEIQQQILLYTDIVTPSPMQWDYKKQMFFPAACLWLSACGARLYGGSMYCPTLYLSYSSAYTPHSLPSVYFQVSQNLKAQAEYVFYAQNKFIIDLQGPDFYLSSCSSPSD